MTADRPVELNVRRSIIKRKAPTQSTIEPKGENYDKTTIMLRWATAFLVAIQWLIGNFLQRGEYIWAVHRTVVEEILAALAHPSRSPIIQALGIIADNTPYNARTPTPWNNHVIQAY